MLQDTKSCFVQMMTNDLVAVVSKYVAENYDVTNFLTRLILEKNLSYLIRTGMGLEIGALKSAGVLENCNGMVYCNQYKFHYDQMGCSQLQNRWNCRKFCRCEGLSRWWRFQVQTGSSKRQTVPNRWYLTFRYVTLHSNNDQADLVTSPLQRRQQQIPSLASPRTPRSSRSRPFRGVARGRGDAMFVRRKKARRRRRRLFSSRAHFSDALLEFANERLAGWYVWNTFPWRRR